jgi:hypothetical protein
MSLPFKLGRYVNITSTAAVAPAGHGNLLGFYVNSTTGGTLILKDGGSSGTAISGTITPAIGWHFYPVSVAGELHATIANTLNVTFVLMPRA